VPADCQLCGLKLLSSAHLARSFHHLFPVPAYSEHTGAHVSGQTGKKRQVLNLLALLVQKCEDSAFLYRPTRSTVVRTQAGEQSDGYSMLLLALLVRKYKRGGRRTSPTGAQSSTCVTSKKVQIL
jgi:hypothetical protein